MKFSARFTFFNILFLLSGSIAFSQEWKQYTAEDFNISFQVPQDWTIYVDTEGDIPYLEAVSSDESTYMIIYSYDNTLNSADELRAQAVKDLGIAERGEIVRLKIDSLDISIAEATGVVDEVNAGLYVAGARYETEELRNDYIIYIVTEEPVFKDNKDMMMKIINSIRLVNK